MMLFIVGAVASLLGVGIISSAAAASNAQSPFLTISPAFAQLLGPSPSIELLFNVSSVLFHEAAVYHPPTHSLFTVGNMDNSPAPILVQVTGLNTTTPAYKILNVTALPSPAGGIRYQPDNATDLLAFACIGTNHTPGGIYTLDPYNPTSATVKSLTTSFGPYYRYNSPDDLTFHPSGAIYFTDPVYGYTNNLTGPPQLPNQVYRYDIATNTTRVAADGFGRPNGITHSADGKTIYVGDTGAYVGNGTIDYQGQRSVYAFDVTMIAGGEFLTNRRVLGMPFAGAFDGVKADLNGNVWGGAMGGLEVFSPGGTLLGEINLGIEDNIGDIGFGEPGEIYVMADTMLFRIKVASGVQGVGVGV